MSISTELKKLHLKMTGKPATGERISEILDSLEKNVSREELLSYELGDATEISEGLGKYDNDIGDPSLPLPIRPGDKLLLGVAGNEYELTTIENADAGYIGVHNFDIEQEDPAPADNSKPAFSLYLGSETEGGETVHVAELLTNQSIDGETVTLIKN